MRTFEVNIFRVWFDDVGCNIACDVENTLVVFDSVLIAYRSIGKLVFIFVITFLEINNSLHERMAQVEFNFRMISIVISHNCNIKLLFFIKCLNLKKLEVYFEVKKL